MFGPKSVDYCIMSMFAMFHKDTKALTSLVFSYSEALIRCHIVVLRCHCHYQEVKNCRMPSSIGLSTCFSSSSHAIAICAYNKSLYAIVLFYYKHWQFLLSLILLLPCDMRRLPITFPI